MDETQKNREALFPIVELFASINGEGAKSGQLAIFVRFKGCNLRCSYCDTAWANEETAKFKWMSASQIYDIIKKSGFKNVTLTGGEPLIQKGIENLIDCLQKDGDLRIEVETNGSVSIEKWQAHSERLSFTLDYKSPGSGMQQHMELDNFQYVREKDTVKFVCGSREDLLQAEKIIRTYQLQGRCHVILSPVYGQIELAEMVEFMKEKTLNDVNLQLQLHKVIWDPNERGV